MADMAKERARAERRDLQDKTRDQLAASCRRYGLTVNAHFQPELENERTLWVNCRAETRDTDHAHVYALLDEQGWKPDRERLSRYRQRHDIVRLRHADTDASLVLIIKVPFGSPSPLEAA
jgi:hypothetical protein